MPANVDARKARTDVARWKDFVDRYAWTRYRGYVRVKDLIKVLCRTDPEWKSLTPAYQPTLVGMCLSAFPDRYVFYTHGIYRKLSVDGQLLDRHGVPVSESRTSRKSRLDDNQLVSPGEAMRNSGLESILWDSVR
jgi:hypothetical protein